MTEQIKTTIIVVSMSLTKESINEAVSTVVGSDISNNDEYEIFVVSDNAILQQMREENKSFVLIVDLSNKKGSADYAFTSLVKEYSSDPLCSLMFNSLCHNFLISILANQITTAQLSNEVKISQDVNKDREERIVAMNDTFTRAKHNNITGIIQEMQDSMNAGFEKLKVALTEM